LGQDETKLSGPDLGDAASAPYADALKERFRSERDRGSRHTQAREETYAAASRNLMRKRPVSEAVIRLLLLQNRYYLNSKFFVRNAGELYERRQRKTNEIRAAGVLRRHLRSLRTLALGQSASMRRCPKGPGVCCETLIVRRGPALKPRWSANGTKRTNARLATRSASDPTRLLLAPLAAAFVGPHPQR